MARARRTDRRPRRAARCAVLLLAGLVAAGGSTTARGQATPKTETAPEAVTAGARERLDAIRDDLVALRLEKALAAIEALLGDPAMLESDRLEALVLRAQAHGAFGDFEAIEEDYRQILRSRPAYVPEPSLTPAKAMERFRKVRDAMVGTARITLEPPDARLSVDGKPVVPAPDGTLAMLAGDRLLRATARGHDPEQVLVRVEPGGEIDVKLQLLRNARTVVVRTVPDGVRVSIDGVPVGVTRVPEGLELGVGQTTGELVLQDVALGEHLFELSKPCYATARFRDMLTVDLLDSSPAEYDPVTLQPARSTLRLRGEPAGGEVRVEGQPGGTLPVESLELCPGTVTIEVRASGRIVWRERRALAADEEKTIDVLPRPNAVLVGSSEWPAQFGPLGATFNTLESRPLPAGGAGLALARSAGWSALALPGDTDVALAVLPPLRDGGPERWVLYSPLLATAEPIDAVPEVVRPRWDAPAWGFDAVDGAAGEGALVVDVAAGGPAAAGGIRVGERIVAISGRPVRRARELTAELERHAPGSQIVLQVAGGAGEPRGVALTAGSSPRLLRPGERPAPAAVLAAWGAVDAAAYPDRRPAALANLALLLSAGDRPALAVEHWRRVRWGERSGIGEGTTAYYLSRELERLGREQEAIAQLRVAARSGATTFHDSGPAVAPAARDRLTDLGVALD